MKIMIFGLPGSGKSTYAEKMSVKLKLPVYHLDTYFFQENWQERNYDEFLAMQQELVNKQSWIIEGNATRSFEMRWARADIVIYFHYNRLQCLGRLIKRAYCGANAAYMPPKCTPRLTWKLITYMWYFDRRVRSKIAHLQQLYPNARFYEVTNDVEAQNIFDSYNQ